MRSRARTRPRRGTALLAALATIAVLTTVTAYASRNARTSALLARNAQADGVARAMTESGVLAARVALEGALREAGGDSTRRVALFDALLDERGATRAARPGAGTNAAPFVADSLDDGVFVATLVNVSARFDLNSGDDEGLTRLLTTVVPASDAARLAQRIGDRVRGRAGAPVSGNDERALERDSLVAALLGRRAPAGRRAFASLDEVQDFLGDDAAALAPLAPLLTVDGDGRIDRRHADPRVVRAASGSLVDAPTRVLIIARGWQDGQLLTREIQAVYSIEGDELRLVTWREQSR